MQIINPFKPGSQYFRLLEALMRGAVTNAQIIRAMGIFNSTGRISDIRKAIASQGWDVEGKNLGGGLWEYSLIPPVSTQTQPTKGKVLEDAQSPMGDMQRGSGRTHTQPSLPLV